MKAKLLLSLLGLWLGVQHVFAQGTAFTYQGWLNDGSSPATGLYDFTFTLFNVATSSGTVGKVGATQFVTGLPVSNGVVMVTLDFGPGIFNGTRYWLEIFAGTNGSTLTRLDPRQELTPTPYAIFAESVASVPDGSLPANVARLNATQTFTGNNTFNNVTLAPPATLAFGATRRQMLNLYNADFGFGVQDFTLYSRGSGFAWYRGGVHSNNQNDPGTGGISLMTLDSAGHLLANAGVSVDTAGVNDGSYYPGLVFGPGSGESIASKRTAGGNQYGLDFYTSFANRMSIANNGNVGIGTGTQIPQAKLDVNGTVRASGVISAAGGLVIESRASDPVDAVTGQIWLLTNP